MPKPSDANIVKYLRSIDREDNRGNKFTPEPENETECRCHLHALHVGYFLYDSKDNFELRKTKDGFAYNIAPIRGLSEKGYDFIDRFHWRWWSRAQSSTIFVAAIFSIATFLVSILR